MGMQAMITHTDAQTSGYPEQKNSDRKTGPVEHKKRDESANMENRQSQNCGPVHLLAARDADNVRIHRSSGLEGSTIPKLAGIWRAICKNCVLSREVWGHLLMVGPGREHWRGQMC
jgi:hypothetical protein